MLSRSVCVQKYQYLLNEYTIDIPKNIILNVEEGKTKVKDKIYDVKIYQLKWSKTAILLFDENGLADIQIDSRSIIDNANKVMRFIDMSTNAIEL